MKYVLVRIQAGKFKSSNPLRDTEIEFANEGLPVLELGKPLTIVTKPRDEGNMRVITTSYITNINNDFSDGTIEFDTETGSKYQIRRID